MRTYYPASIARGTRLAEPSKIRGGAVTYLAELGHAARRVREDVSARMPTPEEADVLVLETPVPVLVLTRLTLDADDRPIQGDVMVKPHGRHRYELAIG